jgi:hypothetical protein
MHPRAVWFVAANPSIKKIPGTPGRSVQALLAFSRRTTVVELAIDRARTQLSSLTHR